MSSTATPQDGTAGMIRRHRERLGWSKRELGRRVGVSHTAVRLWEDGRGLNQEHLSQVIDVLDVPADEVREALITFRENGSGCFRCAWAALGNYIAGVLAGTLEPRWGLA